MTMRNLFSTLTLTVCLCSFISCTNDEQEADISKTIDTRSEIEVINGGTMLRFKDMNAYENMLFKISAMTIQERFSYLDSLSFRPQVMIMQEADDELENICDQAIDKVTFDALYQKYKQKHGGMFIFNESDSSDLSPHSRLLCPVDEHFVNAKGQFMIGDSLVNSKMYSNYGEREQQFALATTRGVSDFSSINNAFSRQSERKVGLEFTANDTGTSGGDGGFGKTLIHATFTSQKKTAFGWVRYDTNYHVDFCLYGANFEFAQGGFQGSGPAYIPFDGRSLGFAIELGGHETRIFGRKAWGATCLGDFAVWSRGIPYAQRGSSSVKL